jgi:hypothetical protein
MPATWIEACRPPQVPGTQAHASALTPIVFLLVHVSWITFGLVLLTATGVATLSIKGRSVTWLVRKVKCNLRGRRVSARPVWFRRRSQLVRSHGDIDMSVLRWESGK